MPVTLPRVGARVTVRSFNEQDVPRRGLTFKAESGETHARAVDHPICWLGWIRTHEEGLKWARGWNTRAAKALRAAAAL